MLAVLALRSRRSTKSEAEPAILLGLLLLPIFPLVSFIPSFFFLNFENALMVERFGGLVCMDGPIIFWEDVTAISFYTFG